MWQYFPVPVKKRICDTGVFGLCTHSTYKNRIDKSVGVYRCKVKKAAYGVEALLGGKRFEARSRMDPGSEKMRYFIATLETTLIGCLVFDAGEAEVIGRSR